MVLTIRLQTPSIVQAATHDAGRERLVRRPSSDAYRSSRRAARQAVEPAGPGPTWAGRINPLPFRCHGGGIGGGGIAGVPG